MKGLPIGCVVAATLALAACDACDAQAPVVAEACPAATSAGPNAACTQDLDCPAGSACSTGLGKGPCDADAGQAGQAGACRCVPAYFPEVPSDLLITGLAVSEFDLHVTTGPVTTYGWTAPQSARSVICGLFVAPPEAVRTPTLRIANAARSLYRTHLFGIPDVGSGTLYTAQFTLGDLTTPPSTTCPETSDRFNDFVGTEAAYPIVTTLQIACWAYDDKTIVAATRLLSLQLTDVPEALPPVDDCASLSAGTPDGRLCLLSPLVGGCVDGGCIADAATPATASDPGDGGAGAIVSVPPLASCTGAADLTLCELSTDFQFGRCVGSRCADQLVSQAELSLVTADCSQGAKVDAGPGGGTDWLNCFDDEVQGYGTCYRGSCGLRCVTDSDCAQVQTFLGEVDAGAPLVCGKRAGKGLSCEGRGTSFLGICMPRGASCP